MENVTDRDTCPSRGVLEAPPPEIAATLSVLGGKWKILILWQLLRRPCRFNELRRAVSGISQHMLTLHLRELEQEGVLSRTVFAEVPPRVEYALTAHGATLGYVLKSMAEWGAAHRRRANSNENPDHQCSHVSGITALTSNSAPDEVG